MLMGVCYIRDAGEQGRFLGYVSDIKETDHDWTARETGEEDFDQWHLKMAVVNLDVLQSEYDDFFNGTKRFAVDNVENPTFISEAP